MIPSRVHEGSLRLGQIEMSRLGWAFALSLAIHLLCFGTYELGRKFNVWQSFRVPAWLQKSKLLAVIPDQPQHPPTPPEIPLVYVDVDPATAAVEAPKNTKFYSSRNSQAANPEADKETGIPKITGDQTQVAKAEDTPRSPYDKLMPQFNRAPRDQEAERAKPETPAPPGDLAMARPDATLRQDNGEAEQSRPRTIKEALMRQHRNLLVGQKMKQNGGVGRIQMDSGFDARATPFGVYDAQFIEAVQDRWFDLLDNVSFDGYRRGRVVLQFHLDYEGRITDMKVLDNSVGEMLGLLCQKAVLDPAPYDKWPREMRLMVDKDYREIKFTFFYN
jgi:hypothetical protein